MGKVVVIVGHGAFAVENMRTALVNGAEQVIMVCRRRHIVFPAVANWAISSVSSTVPVWQIKEIVHAFYSFAGAEMPAAFNEGKFQSPTVPAGSDEYFLALRAGKLRVVEGEISCLGDRTVELQSGQVIDGIDVVLKCCGFENESRFMSFDGSESPWITNDPNMLTFSDAISAPRRTDTLLSPSYLLSVRAYARAFDYYRQHPDIFRSDIADRGVTADLISQTLHRFFLDAKVVGASNVKAELPPARFLQEREENWRRFAVRLGVDVDPGAYLELASPARKVAQIAMRNTVVPLRRNGLLVLAPPRTLRILFLHGQGTDSALAHHMLSEAGWGDLPVHWVVPDGFFPSSSFRNPQQQELVGVETLVRTGVYKEDREYREFAGNFDVFAKCAQGGLVDPLTFGDEARNTDETTWRTTFECMREVTRSFGPFDGIAGFCQGATTALVAMAKQAQGEAIGLGSVRFMIAMSPWLCPFHKRDGLFTCTKLQLPTLCTVGDNDWSMFHSGFEEVAGACENVVSGKFPGKHVLAPLKVRTIHSLVSGFLHPFLE